MAEPTLAFTRLAGTAGAGPILIVGPSLGTSVEALWRSAATLLGADWEIAGWDLPAHGRSKPATQPFSIADLAAAVRRGAADLVGSSTTSPRHAAYAAVSLGGTVALEIAVEPGPSTEVACIASAARIGEQAMWQERAALVRKAGTSVMVAGSAERWFAPGFIDRDPTTANRLLLSLRRRPRVLRARLRGACDLRPARPVEHLSGAGGHDAGRARRRRTTSLAEETAATIPDARVDVVARCGQLPPAEDPAGTAALLALDMESGGR
jgi:pimeloyl-ACP methyl ester carboxylesterase